MSSQAERTPADGLERGEVIASRYVVEQLWRNHPLGELYRCRDLTNNDQPVLLQRLRREFAVATVGDRLFDTRGRAALGSALIPDIMDYGADFDGRPFMVSRAPHAAVRTLAELERPIAFDEALAIVDAIATALIPAHAERLVHGGIEPSSVLIERDAEGRPRVVALLGFGLVPALAGVAQSKNLPLVMVPTHVAPELVRGAPMSPAADAYALGILMWELIHGAPPFRGPTLRVLDAHMSRALPQLELPFDVPPAFDWVLRRMLGKSPVDRFPDAASVVEQLRLFAGDGIPDLTGALDPSRPVAAAEVLGSPFRTLGDDDDEEETLMFERPPVEPPANEPPARIDEGPALPTEQPPSRAKLIALATVAAALVLVGVQALINARIDTAAEQLDPPEPAQAVASAKQRPTEHAVPQVEAPRVEPPAIEPLPFKLGNDSFRGQKSALYAKVEHRCLGDRIRRTVKVAVEVAPSGKVDSAEVIGGMAGTGLGRCVVEEASKLEFPATERGGYYVYTLRLR